MDAYVEAAKRELEYAGVFKDDNPAKTNALLTALTYAAIYQAERAAAQTHALERMAESMERALPILGNIAMHLRSIQQTMTQQEIAHE